MSGLLDKANETAKTSQTETEVVAKNVAKKLIILLIKIIKQKMAIKI